MSTTLCLPVLSSCASGTVFTSIGEDATGREVFLTLAVHTSVPGDYMTHGLVSREGQAGGKHSQLQLLTLSPQLTPHILPFPSSPGFITVTLGAPDSGALARPVNSQTG